MGGREVFIVGTWKERGTKVSPYQINREKLKIIFEKWTIYYHI